MSKDQRMTTNTSSRCEVKLDSISNLPSEIIGKILAHLPIEEAVRTSILSTKWRYKPAMLQILNFDDQRAHIVDQVLLLHIGNIYEFQLSHRDFSAAADIDRWLLYLARSSVKCLKLVIPGDCYRERYKLPSCFFSFQDLIHLQLHHCYLKPPSTFRGFKNLEHLDIQHVTFARRVFDDFIVGCPKLKELILKDCDGFNNICIDAPNLKSLAIVGRFYDVISLQNTLNLASVYIKLPFNCFWVGGCSANLLKFIVHLPNIRELHILSCSLKYFALGPLLGKLPQPILLNDLRMAVDFTNLDEISTALCLIRSSPALQRLQIQVNYSYICADADVVKRANSWFENLGDDSDCQLNELRHIDIATISGSKAELDFIKFVLLCSPVLECMTL